MYLVAHPIMNPTQKGLNFLNGRDSALDKVYDDDDDDDDYYYYFSLLFFHLLQFSSMFGYSYRPNEFIGYCSIFSLH